jgi:hypothetical protein
MLLPVCRSFASRLLLPESLHAVSGSNSSSVLPFGSAVESATRPEKPLKSDPCCNSPADPAATKLRLRHGIPLPTGWKSERSPDHSRIRRRRKTVLPMLSFKMNPEPDL